MDKTLQQLGQLLLDSTPTILVFVLLHYYLKTVLYRPLRRVLAERRARVEGKLEQAQKLVATAEAHLAECHETLRRHRVENYRRLEVRRQAARERSQKLLAEARRQSAAALVEARQQLAAESSQARAQLHGRQAPSAPASVIETLSNQILTQVLAPRPQPAASPVVGT